MIELLKIVIGSAVKTFNWDVGPMDTLFGTTATWLGEFPEFFSRFFRDRGNWRKRRTNSRSQVKERGIS